MTNTLREQASFYTKMLMGMAVVAILLVMMAARPAQAETATVTNTNDSGAGSLRAAIIAANSNPGADTIKFDLSGTEVHTISPLTNLPTITDPVTINGYSQPGASPNTLAQGDNAVIKIDLEGSLGTSTDGLIVHASNSGNPTTIKGLAIHEFAGRGIRVDDGTSATSYVVIQGNFIGTDPSGTKDGGNKYVGVYVDGTLHGGGNDLIGGTGPSDRNVISGNDNVGVSIIKSFHNVIQGNYIGTDRDGTDSLTSEDMGNATGVHLLSSYNNHIGGTSPGEGNVISSNSDWGIYIDRSSSYNRVEGNLIGTDRTGKKDLGNGVGVEVEDSYNIQIGGSTDSSSNTIAYSAGAGVEIDEGADNVPNNTQQNYVLCNSIYSNGGLGIDLGSTGLTPNDVDDVDSGPDNLQNSAVITSAKISATGKTTIKGKLDSVPNRSYSVYLYTNPAGTDYGKKYIGTVYLDPNATGDYSFSYTTTLTKLGRNMTATASSVDGTSEFSAPKKVVAF